MNNLIQKYKSLPYKYKIAISIVVFILLVISLPNSIAYIFGAFSSYKLINKRIWKYISVILFGIFTLISLLLLVSVDNIDKIDNKIKEDVKEQNINNDNQEVKSNNEFENSAESKIISNNNQITFNVIKVVDGDTLDVSINGINERLRLIGINTPETVDPRKPVECFGKEASDKSKEMLSGKKVILESDSSQGERDKYGRLLRYVFLEDGTNFNLYMIKNGYAYEYTYNTPYKYQSEFKQAQIEAKNNNSGLWKASCDTKESTIVTNTTTTTNDTNSGTCTIKGNINTKGEKIYHMIGCGSYSSTFIDETKGEKWFCSEKEAVSAGWRKALNCK